jgi:hypothetical protein
VILSPGVKPAFPRAQVWWIGKPQSSAVGRTDRRSADGEVFYGDRTTITRYGIGQVLGVR